MKQESKRLKRKSKKKRSIKDTLNPQKIPKVRREFIDADYLHLLSEKDLQYYAKFIDEYVGANIKKNKKKNIAKGHIHKKNEHAKDIFDSNNRRNNDVYGVTKINGLLTHYEGMKHELGRLNKPELVEEALIAMIDNKDSHPPEDEE